jgi:hypothetical protein
VVNPFYQRKASHDKQTSEFLGAEAPRYTDWEIVTLFYSAVHLINIFFDRHQVMIPRDYDGRYRQIETYLSSILQSYDTLRLLSVMARYEQPVTNQHLVIANECYDDIRATIQSLG